jgi:16S rRNA G1207 methylase RsmC
MLVKRFESALMTDATPDADLHEAPRPRSLPPRPAEAHALEVARGIAGERIVCTSQGRAQAAESLATERPAACVTAWFLDLYRLERARETVAANAVAAKDAALAAAAGSERAAGGAEREGEHAAGAAERVLSVGQLKPGGAELSGNAAIEWHTRAAAVAGAGVEPRFVFACTPDMPPGPFDLAVLPFAKDGEAELTRDILQQAIEQLRIGGHLVAAIDNPRDKWLREQLAATGETVRVRTAEGEKPETICYVVTKTRELAKRRDFSCTITFRDRDRLLTAESRPGVFAHRRIDPGARHLLNAVDVAPDTHVLDIGCGSGCVALGIAARDPSVRVHAIDSAARAVECTRAGAERNGLANITVAIETSGRVPDPGNYDLVLANPPYYADFRIAAMFVDAAWEALAPGGTLIVVTKQPQWYYETLPQRWTNVAHELVKRYHLIEAVKPG